MVGTMLFCYIVGFYSSCDTYSFQRDNLSFCETDRQTLSHFFLGSVSELGGLINIFLKRLYINKVHTDFITETVAYLLC